MNAKTITLVLIILTFSLPSLAVADDAVSYGSTRSNKGGKAVPTDDSALLESTDKKLKKLDAVSYGSTRSNRNGIAVPTDDTALLESADKKLKKSGAVSYGQTRSNKGGKAVPTDNSSLLESDDRKIKVLEKKKKKVKRIVIKEP